MDRPERRLAEIDSLMARSQVAVGVSAIHTNWLFDRAVDIDRLREFDEALRRGVLGRVAVRPVLGAAGDRWTANGHFAPLSVATEVLPRADLEDWIAARAADPIEVYGGPAMRLAVTRLDDGGTAVSLLTSHAIADAQFLSRALSDAAAGRGVEFPAFDKGGKPLRFADEVVWSVRQLGRVARMRIAQARSDQAPVPAPIGPATADEPLAERTVTVPDSFVLPRTSAIIARGAWTAAAESRGGTSSVLAVAVLADLAAVLGRTTKTGLTRVRVPVSIRGDETDLRANAVTGIALDLDPALDRTADLRPVRALLRTTLKELAGRPTSEARMLAVNMVTPRRRFARMVARFTNIDYLSAACAICGEFDSAIARLDGGSPAAMTIGLINRPLETPPRVGTTGGTLTMAIMEVGDTVSLRVAAFHPPNPRTRDELAADLKAVLDRYGLTAKFW
ncbi:hypothetical protein [Antrihabitans sp. YC2-6]|uniref:hypothetical protein n=1 Tax=Antrihabitans sp. YC2-6 TaxID=2799498 RepID=UPI0018F64DA9|nr:hypothetical protein [Antrihabitans sp. YC2-6]MBJ8347529.1 hypothetical protein [Antrihabitans sp. YC2-6]